jgi:enediyne biosynthesis protein E4
VPHSASGPTRCQTGRPGSTRDRAAALALAALMALGHAGCGAHIPAAGALFVDATAETGPDFVHFNGMTGHLYFNEIMGPGAALFDFDGDGDLDAYLGQGHLLGSGNPIFPPAPRAPTDRLFRNDPVADGAGGWRPSFVDVTAASGLGASGYAMGVAVGDYDNDGWPDLYVTNLGANQLWRNRGDGTFHDVTAQAGADDPRWSTSATFLDYDDDGWLDLFVASYVQYRVEAHKECLTSAGVPDYCGPQSYEPTPDRLLRNRGDGTFTDVTWQAGLEDDRGSGLGVVAADLDDDGRMDLYVANDLMRNFLWLNQGDGTFRNVALMSGTAVNMAGAAQASMGIEADDLDNDGDLDLFMTHLTGDTNTFYRNAGGGVFDDVSAPSRLGPLSLEATGFGVAALDVDNDGWLDLFVANGAVKQIAAQRTAGEPYPLRQPNQLFHNQGDGTFAPWGADTPALAPVEVTRSVAVGDVDNDGDGDLLLANNSGPARLLLDRAADGTAWIGVDLRLASGRSALGWSVGVTLEEGRSLERRVRGDGSFCAARDARVLLGAGSAVGARWLRLERPGHAAVVWVRPPLRRLLVGRVGERS